MSVAAQVGRRIGDAWVLTDLIGEGPNGAVYEALPLTDGVRRSLKILHGVRASTDDVQALIALSECLGALDPAFVAVLDAGTLPDGTVWLVTPRVRGASWSSLLDARGWVAPSEVADVLGAAARCLDGAREAGLAHGNIHPGNVWKLDGGGMALTDAGIRSLPGARPDAEDDDVRALAAMAFELMTGVPAYPRERRGSAARPITLAEAGGIAFGEAIEQALGRALWSTRSSPAYASAGAFVDAFAAALEETPSATHAEDGADEGAETTRVRPARQREAMPASSPPGGGRAATVRVQDMPTVPVVYAIPVREEEPAPRRSSDHGNRRRARAVPPTLPIPLVRGPRAIPLVKRVTRERAERGHSLLVLAALAFSALLGAGAAVAFGL